MLHDTQALLQNANPYIIEAMTHAHGVYVTVYNKDNSTEYDEGRDNYASNVDKFKSAPIYIKKKMLLLPPVQETYASGEDSFDNYMEDTYILTCDRTLDFKEEQKFEIFYDKDATKPSRVLQCFEVRENSNVDNKNSIRKVMLKPFN